MIIWRSENTNNLLLSRKWDCAQNKVVVSCWNLYSASIFYSLRKILQAGIYLNVICIFSWSWCKAQKMSNGIRPTFNSPPLPSPNVYSICQWNRLNISALFAYHWMHRKFFLNLFKCLFLNFCEIKAFSKKIEKQKKQAKFAQ